MINVLVQSKQLLRVTEDYIAIHFKKFWGFLIIWIETNKIIKNEKKNWCDKL